MRSVDTFRQWGKTIEGLAQRALATAGAAHSQARIAAHAQAYWRSPDSAGWRARSHWRGGLADDLWSRTGAQHLDMFRRGARAVGFDRPWDRVVDWGCGGGANAVPFAPHARELVGVDISHETVTECGRQVAAVCATPYRPLVVDVTDPEAAVDRLGAGTCDVFLCLYVLELVPTPEYGARLLRIARDLLASGGAALVQTRYSDGRWSTRPRRRGYRHGVADMTTYPIHVFWELAVRCGLRPELIELVPSNELDERYAYYFLTRE